MLDFAANAVLFASSDRSSFHFAWQVQGMKRVKLPDVF